MSNTVTDNLENTRKRLIFQSGHRGTKELDLLLGNFASRYLAEFNAEQLAQFAALLDCPDLDIFQWYSGEIAVPDSHNNPVTELFLNFKLSF